MKVVIDAFGGDNAPYEVVKGCKLALKKNKDLEIVLTGDEVKIKQQLKELDFESEHLTIVNAPEVILNNESPTEAIRLKKNSSLVRAFDILKEDEEVIGLISAGSTGAILTGGFLKIGRIKGISRPALAPFIPNKKGGFTIVIDSGANMDCDEKNLCHFALMGSAYYSALFGVKNPRVALLNVGTEDHKGNELIKKTFPLLQEMNINFVGNMEARDVFSGDYNVVVADGFAGNVLLKSVEGAASLIKYELITSIKKGFGSKIGAMFMVSTFKNMKKKFDYNQYGGSPFLGCKKIVLKAHGSSKAKAFKASIEQIISLNENKLIEKIEKSLEETNK